jgi:hypothetical protein
MFRLSLRTCISLSVVSLALFVTPAYSVTITTYSDPTAWTAAATGLQEVTFTGLAPAGSETTYNTSTGVTSDGVEFIGYTATAGSYDIMVLDTSAAQWSQYYNFGTGDALALPMNRPNSGSSLPYIQISLPTPVTAFSMNLFTGSPNALNYTITVAGTPYTVATYAVPTPAFWGVTSDTPISTITLTLQGTTYMGSSTAFLDNFQFGSAALEQAPEAATFLLIGSGLIGIIALKRRMNRGRPASITPHRSSGGLQFR